MAKVLFVSALVALSAVLAEPPAGNRYLPPPDRYGAPSASSRIGGNGGTNGFHGSLSAEYGAPSTSNHFNDAPSSQYGAPLASGRNGGSHNFNGASGRNGASHNFNGGSARFSSAPSSRYGAPASSRLSSNGFGSSSSRFSSSLTNGAGAANGFGSHPSSQYGAPSAARFTSSNGFGSAPSSQYGAPELSNALASSYAAPGISGRPRGSPAPVYGAPFAGYSASTEDPLAEPANYEFSYGVQDADSGSDFGHQESRQEEQALGEYRVLLPDGRTQIVEYEANEGGYMPKIRYEEPNGGYAASQRSHGGPY